MTDNTENGGMNMEDFESMLDESLQLPQKGSLITGSVAQITDTDILINIGYKTEGIVNRSEFEKDGELTVSEGDDVEVMFLGLAGGGGYVKLSKKALYKEQDWLTVENALETGEPVKVKIIDFNEKGFRGAFNDVDCFIPENHIDIKSRQKEAKEYVGQELDAKVLKINKRQRSFLGSVKLCLIEQFDKQKKEFFETVSIGEKLTGSVKNIKNYGVFLNFGAVDGFMHKNNISWGVVKHPSQYVKDGEEIEVEVIGVDREEEKLEVGLKQLFEDPWEKVAENYPVNKPVKGMVITRKNKGFILELEPGVDGFVPEDEISWLKNVRPRLEPKQDVEGVVIGIDEDKKKVLVSLKLLTDNPWDDLKKDHPEGSVVKGTIKSITDFGIFVDFGSFLDGLIRKKDISWTEEEEAINNYKEGDEIEAKILKIDPERERISLGIKQLEANPWKEAAKSMPVGKVTDVEITAVNKDGLVVDIGNDVTGFIPVNELSAGDKVNPEEKFKAGETIKAQVIKNSIKERSVLLSVRKFMMDSERKEVKEYMKKMEQSSGGGDFSLGSMIKDQLNQINENGD